MQLVLVGERHCRAKCLGSLELRLQLYCLPELAEAKTAAQSPARRCWTPRWLGHRLPGSWGLTQRPAESSRYAQAVSRNEAF